MSYCRFSSDNFRCDVYVYEDCYGGWTTHVAGRRHLFPVLPSISGTPVLLWLGIKFGPGHKATYPSRAHAATAACWIWIVVRWERLRDWLLDRNPLRPIGLPFDGERYNDDTPGECAARLKELSRIGYNVPKRAIKALEIEEAGTP
mgnify:FL=1